MSVAVANIPIFVINMNKDKDRLNKISSHLSNQNLTFERIPAVHGGVLSKDERKRLTTASCNKYCSPTMIGCSLSHHKIWEKILKDDIKYAIVLEDDVRLENNFLNKLEYEMNKLPENFDILLLGHLFPSCFEGEDCPTAKIFASVYRKNMGSLKMKNEKYSDNILKMTNGFAGTYAYLITNRGAKKLLEIMPLVDYHIDVEMSRHMDKIDCYGLINRIVDTSNSSKDSSNSSQYPVTFTKPLDKIEYNNIGIGWLLNMAIFRVGSFDVNALCILISILMLVLGYFRVVAVWFFIFLIQILEYINSPKRQVKNQITGLTCLMVVFWTVGFGISNILKKN